MKQCNIKYFDIEESKGDLKKKGYTQTYIKSNQIFKVEDCQK